MGAFSLHEIGSLKWPSASPGDSTTSEHQAGRLYLAARVMDMESESFLTWRLNFSQERPLRDLSPR
jgi:hypothetical protein